MNIPDQIERTFHPLLEVLRDLRRTAAAAINRFDGRNRNAGETTFLLFLNRATETLGALECLFVAGWSDASALLRSLVDTYIELLYIETDRPKLLAKFNDYGPVSSLARKETIARILGKSVDELLAAEYEKFKDSLNANVKNAADYAAEFRRTVEDARAKWNYPEFRWDKSTYKKALAIDEHRKLAHAPHEMKLVYELPFGMGSEELHPSHRSLYNRVETNSTTTRLRHDARYPLRPIDSFLVLMFSTLTHMKILDNVNSILALGVDADLTRLDGSWKDAWQKTAQNISATA